MRITARAIAGIVRLPFLILAPACVLPGIGTASLGGGAATGWDIALVLAGAIAAHAAVNALNEVFDFRSGLDARTTRTPFSGGSGTLPADPSLARLALWLGIGALVLACAIGLRFVVLRGAALLPIGLLGVATVLAYTPWATRRSWASLLAPGLGFGPAMVIGTHVALTGRYDATAIAASLLPGCLASALLFLNQFPDIEADRSVGRRHLPMLLGRRRAARVYALLVFLAYVALGAGVMLHLLPAVALWTLVTLPLAIATVIGVLRDAEDPARLLRWMGLDVALAVLAPTVLGAALLTA